MNHFIFHCDIARDIWTRVFSLFVVQLVMPRMVVEFVLLLERIFRHTFVAVNFGRFIICA